MLPEKTSGYFRAMENTSRFYSLRRLAVLLGALLLAATLPTVSAFALTFREADFICPIDGKTFKARVVGSYTQFGMRLDLKPFGALIAPIPMPVCPDNGFVMFKKQFSDAEIAKLKPIVLGDEYRRTRQQHTDHYMAAYLLERLGADDLELAHLYLKASWEAETRKAPALVEQYRLLALHRFESFLKKDTSRSPQWWSTAVVSAELERLLGRFDEAEKRLGELPVAELEAKSVLHKVIQQIRTHAKNHNVSPEQLAK